MARQFTVWKDNRDPRASKPYKFQIRKGASVQVFSFRFEKDRDAELKRARKDKNYRG